MPADSPSTPTQGEPASVGLTLLWGTWEMWCDVAAAGSTAPLLGDSAPRPAVERANWLSQVRSIGLFDSAEGFWGLFNCVLLPSQLPPNSSYYLFRRHIAPMWEHEANRRGGKWVIPVAGPTVAAAAVEPGAAPTQPVDVMWEKLCLAAIGEQFPGDEMDICGITVSRGKPRPGSSYGEWKLCLWTRTADNAASQAAIAQYMKALLGLGDADDSDTLSPGRAGAEGRERQGESMTFWSHRALMEAKQKFAEGTQRAQPFHPLYKA